MVTTEIMMEARKQREESLRRAKVVAGRAEADLGAKRFLAALRTAEAWLWQKNLPHSLRKRFQSVERTASVIIRNQSRSPKALGKDRYGFFFNFTGNEAIGSCFWCGKKTALRYCTGEHGKMYRRQYYWPAAMYDCIDKYELVDGSNFCGDCGFTATAVNPSNLFVVHHIMPLDGDERGWHILNQQHNLVLLCKSCHQIRHTQWNYLMRKATEPFRLRMERSTQLQFRFMERNYDYQNR